MSIGILRKENDCVWPMSTQPYPHANLIPSALSGICLEQSAMSRLGKVTPIIIYYHVLDVDLEVDLVRDELAAAGLAGLARPSQHTLA